MFSSSWTDRQGQVGDLKNQSKEELTELLLRQEKILSNKKLLQTLPDKGKKIKEFAEKVRLAIEEQSEEETRKNMVSAARTELQSKYQKAVQQRAISIDSHQNKLHEDAAGEDMQDSETSPVAAQEDTQLDQYVSRAAVESMETAAAGTPLNIDETKEGELVEALDRVTLSETGSGESKDQNNSRTKENYFLRKQPSKKPHYVTVLEKTEAASRRPKFKPNQLAPKQEASSSGCSSPGQSSVSASPLSAQARRERDWKHLDDITAAKLPPLHHNPAQLLSLEESAVLLKEQTKKHQELQAKLSEGLKTSMGSYTPDGGPMAAYREVHDEGVHLSSEED